MADSDVEKTEPASPRRLEKAKEEGQTPRSRELNTFLLLALGVATLWMLGQSLYTALSSVVQRSMWFDPGLIRDDSLMVTTAVKSASQAFMAILPLFGVLFVVAIFSSVALGGLIFSAKALEPKLEKLNLLKGIKRMFSAQSLIELLKALGKVFLIGTVAVLVMRHYQGDMLGLMHLSPTEGMVKGLELVALCCALIISSLLLIVAIDVPWQIYSHLKKLRMSKQDLKDEHKQSDGDPHVKGRIRSQQRAMAQRRMMSEVPQADVVITNPTHYAVALKYAEGQAAAPKVVAKGMDLTAQRIKDVASEARVPLFEAPALARALNKHVELNQEIPVELYSAVAEVLAWVYQLRNWERGEGTMPPTPSNLNIPAGMDPQESTSTGRQ
ncbi:flagellar biosynthesis protein FlhB [Paenalcaligenes faecalis]|uniref:flagellar biosynthesis protein FlhB n=1 Tax=Paenalcaligenes faecalis TaxID=2980099 RepID=UPI0022B9BD2F|nr:flagellar biosynthesis protein FlhB [Paenalcaligenes faecalis]